MRCSPLDSAHEATVGRSRAGLGCGVAVVASAVVLFVIVLDVGRTVVGDVTRADVQLAVQEGAEFSQLMQNDEDRRPLRLRIGDDLGQARA